MHPSVESGRARRACSSYERNDVLGLRRISSGVIAGSGAGPDEDGIYTLALHLTDELEPGEYHLTVTAQIGDTSAWSATSQ